MKYITEETNETRLNNDLTSFLNVATLNKVALGLQTTDLTEMTTLFGSYSTSLTSTATAKAAAKSAVEQKDLNKKAARQFVAKWAKIWRANNAISDPLLDQLMLPPHKTPATKTPPTQPTNLVATDDGLGRISLKWRRNGNTPSTTFTIESKNSPSADWVMIDATTKTRFEFQATAGVPIWFRVVAKRNDQSSPASTPVSMWESGESATLQIAA